MQAAQFGQRIGVVVGSDVEIGIRIGSADLERGALPAALVAASGFSCLHGGEQAFGEAAFGRQESVLGIGHHALAG